MSTRTPPHMATLIALTASSVLSLNLFLPALPQMTTSLQTRESVIALAVSGYMVVGAIAQLTLGPLSDRLGRRSVLLGALLLYTLASVGCMLAPDATSFLAFRLIQGVVVAGSVISSAIVRDLFDRRQAAAKLGTIGAVMAIGPMLGPMLGGALQSLMGWRAIFALYSLLGLFLLILCHLDLGETRKNTGPRHYRVLLRSRLFWAYASSQALSVGGFYVFLAGVSFVAARQFGLNPALVGVGLGSITAGFMLGSTLTARLAPRYGILRLMIAGRVCALTGPALSLLAFSLGAQGALWLFGLTILVGVGNGLTIPNANAGALSAVPEQAGAAAGLSGAFGMVMGAALTWGAAVVIEIHPTARVLLLLLLCAIALSALAALAAWRLDPDARRAQ